MCLNLSLVNICLIMFCFRMTMKTAHLIRDHLPYLVPPENRLLASMGSSNRLMKFRLDCQFIERKMTPILGLKLSKELVGTVGT